MSTLDCDNNGLLSRRLASNWLAQRIYYGWVMLVIATLAIICTSPAQTFGVAAFNESFRRDLNLSHSQLAGAYMLGTLLAALPMSYIGALADRFGLRRTKIVVVALLAGACVLTAAAFNVFTLFIAFLLLRMLGQGALSMLSGNTLAFWFERRLGTVEGIRHFGMAGAIAFVPSINLWLIDAVGWRWAWVLLGLAVLIIMLPLLIVFFYDHPEHVGQRKDGLPEPAADAADDDPFADDIGFTLRQAIATPTFWIVAGTWALWGLAATAVTFSILPLFADRGLSETDVALLFTIFAASLATMHLVGGVLADKVPPSWLLTVGAWGIAATMLLFCTTETRTGVVASGIAMGLTQGLLSAVIAPLWPRYYGRQHIGSIRGCLATITVASTSAGPLVMGVTRDLSGAYTAAILLFAGLAVPLALLGPLAKRPSLPTATD